MTLAAVLTLGAATGGRAQDLSGSVSPGGGFPLPSVPEDWNWADLPFKLTASQTVSYNSNVSSFPVGVAPVGTPVGDFTTTTNVGFSTKANVENQQLFLDATFGVVRYLHNVQFDTTIYSINGGVDWNVTSRCSGTLTASLSKSPAQLNEQVGTGVNFVTTNAFNETGKCGISNGYSLLFNTGLTDLTNSNVQDAFNNSRTALIAAGVEYEKGASTVTALASLSDQTFTSRNALNSPGLATQDTFHSFTLEYARQINPNLTVNGTIGLVGITNDFTLALPKTLLPIYALGARWTVAPKLTLNVNAAKSIAPPTTIIANAQESYNVSVGLVYQMTPKLSLTALGSADYSTGQFTGETLGTTPFLIGAQRTYSLSAGLIYSMTPFLTAGLNAQYFERVVENSITPQDVITVSLNYRPY